MNTTVERFGSNMSDKEYPKAGTRVDGLEVTKNIPNQDSIGATFTDYTILDGVREVPYKGWHPENTFYAANDWRRSEKLAEDIKSNGWIDPLIVAVEDGEPYILEGVHRFVALHLLGKSSFPALVVIEESEPKIEAHVDQLPGGLADDKSPEDFPADKVKQGIEVELEHTDDPAIALEITMDHLTEDIDYYNKLAKVESVLKALAKVLKFPKQPRILEKENEEFQFKVGEDLLHPDYKLTPKDIDLMDSELDRYEEVMDLLEREDRTAFPKGDVGALTDLWVDYNNAIVKKMNQQAVLETFEENEEFQFKVGEDLLKSDSVLTPSEVKLMRSEIDRYSEVMDLFDGYENTDYMEEAWENYIEAIETRLKSSLKALQRKRLRSVGKA